PLLGLIVANPIVAAVIALLVGGAFLVWKYWEPIKGFFSGLWTTVTEESAAAWRAVTDPLESARRWFSEVFADIAEAIRDPLGLLGRFGGMMDSLASSIFSGADKPVAALRATTQDMRDLLPSSPAKTGPLSDIGSLRFMETIADAIRPEPLTARLRDVLGFAFDAERAPLAQRLAFAGPGGGLGPVTIRVHHAPAYHLAGPVDARGLAELKAQSEEDAHHLARRIDEVRRRRERGDFS
ncbi:MAG: hypothetical protein K8I02_08125, partial [Candidatus Methylomirabilis sp.]|nr:hypothetical protein [Deltaproteobacteria bacterium]